MGTFDQINSSINLVRELISAKEKLQVAELQVKLADVLSNLAETKVQMTELQEVNYKLKKEIESSDKKTEMLHAFRINPDEGFYILDKEIHGYKPGNYCPACFGKEEKLILLMPYGTSGHRCNGCKSEYYRGASKPSSAMRTMKTGW